jgi:HAD superfamily hydrolase (TIGR01458 family)
VTELRGVVLDMEGVLHIDWKPLPGAARAVAALREQGLELAILTNTTGKTPHDMAKRLAGMGMAFDPDRIVTAAWATAEHLRKAHPGARVHALVEGGASDDLAGLDLVDDPAVADVIVLGGPDGSWTYARLNAVFRALREGAELVAMQRNRWWTTAAGPALDAGMFVAGLEYAAQVEATVIGKPSREIYRTACATLGAEPAAAMMVGDDLESDLPPARAIGMRTCLVRTGKGSTFPGEAGTDLDLPDLAALPQALGCGAG